MWTNAQWGNSCCRCIHPQCNTCSVEVVKSSPGPRSRRPLTWHRVWTVPKSIECTVAGQCMDLVSTVIVRMCPTPVKYSVSFCLLLTKIMQPRFCQKRLMPINAKLKRYLPNIRSFCWGHVCFPTQNKQVHDISICYL